MQAVNEKAGPHAKNLTKKLSVDRFAENKHVKMVSEKTGLDADVIIAAAVVIVCVIAVLTSFGREVVGSVFVLGYPAWKSFCALQTPEAEDDKKWLTYWITYGAVMIIDSSLTIITSQIPFFQVLKFFFLISLIHGKTELYVHIFDYAIKPFFDRFNGEIDTGLTSLNKAGDDLINDAKKLAMDKMQAQLNKDIDNYKGTLETEGKKMD